MEPQVSVIIPVYLADRLADTLKALATQSAPLAAFEVIVIENRSPDDVAAIVASHGAANVQLVREPQPGSYAARNRGLAIARGRVLAFTDADCSPHADWIDRGLAAVALQPGPAVLGGRIETAAANAARPSVVEVYDALIWPWDQRGFVETHGFAAGANIWTTAAVLARIGAFDATLRSSGDAEFCRRAVAAGIPLLYVDAVAVSHPARTSYRHVFQRTRRILGGRIAMRSRYAGEASVLTGGLGERLRLFGELVRGAFGLRQKIGLVKVAAVLAFAVALRVVEVLESLRLRLGFEAVRE